MSGKPDKLEIRVKEYGGTYIATAREVKVRASCTSGAEAAARACAEKIFGVDGFTLHRRGDGAAIWTAEAKSKIGPAWETGVPDADILVLIRGSDDEYPVWTGFYDGEQWCLADGTPVDSQCPGLKVTGWMHLDTAASILDGAPF